MVMLAQDGPAAFRDRYELIYRHRAEGPNALWQADHTRLDVLVLDANGEAVRPWLTIIMDDYSRAVAGYTISWRRRQHCKQRWPYARRCGASSRPYGPSAGSLTCSTWIMGVILPVPISSRSRRTCIFN